MDEGYNIGGSLAPPGSNMAPPGAPGLEPSVLLEPWREDDLMANFTQELDPLPPLFPFTPPTPTTPYRCEGGQDVAADVLLSLKHAVVHPPSPPPLYSTLHNLQVGGYGNGATDLGGGAQNGPTSHHHYMFPSMSVNVSMTMHGCYSMDQPTCQTTAQMTWSGGGCDYGGGYPTNGDCVSDYLGHHDPITGHHESPLDHHHHHSENHHSNHNENHHQDHNGQHLDLGHHADHHLHLVHDLKEPCSPGANIGLGSPPRPNLCRICGKTYARPSTLKTHLRTHSGEKPYRCDDCNKSFSQAANLTAHVRTHSGEKPFRCPICARRFSQSSSVTTHMRTHSGERPYRCRLCKKAFSDSSTLTKHLRIHSGEKPYQCKLCLLRFSQSGNLNRHMRVHGGTLAC